MPEENGSLLPQDNEEQQDLIENLVHFVTFQPNLSSSSLLIEADCCILKRPPLLIFNHFHRGFHQAPSPTCSHISTIQASFPKSLRNMLARIHPKTICIPSIFPKLYLPSVAQDEVRYTFKGLPSISNRLPQPHPLLSITTLKHHPLVPSFPTITCFQRDFLYEANL